MGIYLVRHLAQHHKPMYRSCNRSDDDDDDNTDRNSRQIIIIITFTIKILTYLHTRIRTHSYTCHWGTGIDGLEDWGVMAVGLYEFVFIIMYNTICMFVNERRRLTSLRM